MNKIKCEICGKKLHYINVLHLKTHNITVKEYKKLYPNSPITSEEHKNKIRKGQNSCNVGLNNGNWKGGKTKIKIIKQCEWCGNDFETLEAYSRRFCTRDCVDEWQKSNNNPIKNKPRSNDIKDKIAITKTLQWADKEFHINHSGPNHPLWLGHTEYCYLFNEPMKTAIRNYFNNICFMSGITKEEHGQNLNVHHVNYQKECGCTNTQFCLYIPVTRSWNMKFNGNTEKNRWYWYSYLMVKIFIKNPNYYQFHCPVWGFSELYYNYEYVFEKARRNRWDKGGSNEKL